MLDEPTAGGPAKILTYQFDFWNNTATVFERRSRYDRFGERRGEVIQLQKTLPIGEGLGYTVTLERSRIAEDTMTVFSPSLQYNARWGAVRADLSQQRDATGSHRSYALSAAGGIAMVGDVIAVGRPVTDSFGLVKVDDLPGVRVLVNNQAIGTTDASGKLFLPTLTAFYENQVSIDVASVPIEYAFPESLRIVSPALRAGALVNARITRVVYGCDDPKAGACTTLFTIGEDTRLNHRGTEAAARTRPRHIPRRAQGADIPAALCTPRADHPPATASTDQETP